MSKKVIWEEGKYTSQKTAGTYGSYQEFLAKANRLKDEQDRATAYLQKAMPAMLKLLEIRFENREPLVVMRPLRYQTSMLKSQMEDDLDRSFYNNHASQEDTFKDVVMTITPGTHLVLKSLDPNLREFIFEDALKKEHCVSYDERNSLLTQTDIFETVYNLLESSKGE